MERYGERRQSLPWRVGSGIAKGDQQGHFFCATVGDRIYLRFIPLSEGLEVISEIGTCLRLIECSEETPRILSLNMALDAYKAWNKAKQSIFDAWTFETDPANLHPKVRKLNREVAVFIRKNPPDNIDQN